MKHSWSKNLSCFKWPTLHLTRPDIGTPKTLNTGPSDNEILLTKKQHYTPVKSLSCFKWPSLHLTRPDIGTPQTLNTGPSDNERLLTKATPHSQLRVRLVSVAKPTPTRPTSGRPKIHKTGQHKCSVSSCNRTRNISQRLRCLSTFQTYPENFNVKLQWILDIWFMKQKYIFQT